MKKIVLAGAAVVFAGIAATIGFAADHKAKPAAPPARVTVITPAKSEAKTTAPKKHHGKRHHGHHRTAHHVK